ncbi:MAG: hypothetical protein RLY50_999 [Actinomycetota bacterium]
MNERIRRLTIAFVVLFGVLFIQLSMWQVVRRDELVQDSRNNVVDREKFNSPRGRIVTADAVVIAETVRKDSGEFQWQRVYAQGDLYPHITGYYTLSFGTTQLEHLHRRLLSADTPGAVQVTLRDDLQQLAKRALAGRVASVVAVDTRTGGVLAMYSNPSYDPNLVAQHDGAAALEYLQALQADPEKPLLGNAFQERYMPGSTFKILTTAIGLETGKMTTASTFPDERAWVPPNTNRPIRNYDGRVCGGDLAEVFRRSCNIPFAKTAVEIGPSEMVAGVKRFALGQRLPIDLQGAASSTFGGEAADFENSLALLAIHGFGQGGVQMVPLHMAMISASVANGGQMLEPHVTAQTLRDDSTLVVANGALTYDPADVVSTTQPTPWRRTMAPETAATLTNLMIGVTESGTAACCLQIPGVKIAAKTGTAQLNPEGEQERSHAWITAFAPADAPRIAVAVMLKGTTDEISAGTGGRLAGPVARELLQKALQVVP